MSGGGQRVISPSGPPELYAAGADAEAIRRALVHEQDAARAAGEGLAQEGPVVAALRADLASDQQYYNTLLEKRRELAVQVGGEGGGTIVTISNYSRVPRAPVGPYRTRTILIAFLLSLAIGVGLGLPRGPPRVLAPEHDREQAQHGRFHRHLI